MPVDPHQSVTPFYRDRARYLRKVEEKAQELIDLLDFVRKMDEQEAGHSCDVTGLIDAARAMHNQISTEKDVTQQLSNLECKLAQLAVQIYKPRNGNGHRGS